MRARSQEKLYNLLKTKGFLVMNGYGSTTQYVNPQAVFEDLLLKAVLDSMDSRFGDPCTTLQTHRNELPAQGKATGS